METTPLTSQIASFLLDTASAEEKQTDVLDLLPQIQKEWHLTDEESYYLKCGIKLRAQRRDNRLPLPIGLESLKLERQTPELLLGILFFECGNLSLSLEKFRLLRQSNSLNLRAIAILAAAENQKSSGNFTAALAEYSQINLSGILPELEAAIYRGFASVHRQLKDNHKAELYIKKALKLFPKNYRALFSLGYLYQQAPELSDRKGHLQKAKSAYEESIAKGAERDGWGVPNFHLALVECVLGDIIKHQERLSEAINLLSRTNNPYDNINVALAMILLENYQQGMEVLQNCLTFVEMEPVLCAVKNAEMILHDHHYSENIQEQISRYIALCNERLNDLRRGESLYKGEGEPLGKPIASTCINALVVFIDIRGFTSWTSHLTPTDHLLISGMLHDFYGRCARHLRTICSFLKFEGDGLMFISRIYGVSPSAVEECVQRNLRSLSDILFDFQTSEQANLNNLRLGIGCVVGQVVRMYMRGGSVDYVGHRVNLAARLCDRARPGGVVICRDEDVIKDPVLKQALEEAVEKSQQKFQKGHCDGLKGIDGKSIQVYASPSVQLTDCVISEYTGDLPI